MIRFEEETHRYFDGEKELISVTRLMAKHGLAPDYSGVPESVLRAKAERGSLIHKEIETYIKTGEIGFTSECWEFADYIGETGTKVTGSEKIVHNDVCAGTVDLFLIDVNGNSWIADIKTTAALHEDAISWQLSIYNALSGYTAKRFSVFHFNKDCELKVKDIVPKSKEEVERLFECERNGERFYPETPVIIEEARLAQLREFEAIIAEATARKKEAEEKANEIKAAIIRAMEESGVKSFESDGLKITYVAPYEKKGIDSERLKKEMPEIAEKYTKESTVKAAVRVTIK